MYPGCQLRRNTAVGTVTGLEVFLYQTNMSEALIMGQRDLDGARVRYWNFFFYSFIYSGVNIRGVCTGHGSHFVPVPERGWWHMVEIRKGPKIEHYDFTRHNRYQRKSKRPECGETRLRVSGRKGTVYLSRIHAEFVFDPVSDGVHIENVRMSHVFFYNC